MNAEEIIKCTDFVTSATDFISNHGVELETGSDFVVLEKALKEHSARGPLTPKFDPQNNDLDENTAFWILGRDNSGEIVHTQAVRLLDLEGGSLASYLALRFDDFTPDGWSVDTKKSRFRPAPGSKSIEGTVCYHGEFWLNGGKRGVRGTGLTVLAARLAMVISLMKWSPDYIFAFMHSLTICKGLAAKAGFMHTEQNNLFWSVIGKEERLEAWTAWVSREDIRHLLGIPPIELVQQLNSVQTARHNKKAA